jgi:mRNA deadenylase 3'-5' endonuclease subunit Ccr4
MDLYYNVPRKHLEWSRRKHLICKEISRYNASILCLQEVDRFDDLDVLLKNRGFRGVHKVYIRVKSFITLYAMVPFSYI